MTFHIPFICKLFTTNFTRIFSNLMYEFMFLYIDENDREIDTRSRDPRHRTKWINFL